jgi:tRNA pseudouridine synthase 10
MVQDGEQNKQKSYEAICKLPCPVTPEIVEKINASKDLLLGQNTPTRVAHRRALLLRERMVYSMHCTPLPDDPTTLKLNLRTPVPPPPPLG